MAASAVAQLSGYLLFAGLLCGFAWSCPARAGSIVASAAPNGALLDADGIVAFEGATVTDFINFIADPETANSDVAPFVSTATPNTILLPTVGDFKDEATGVMVVLFEFGTPVAGAVQPEDTITFTVFAEASAVAAKNSVGEEASAQVFLLGTVQFFLDPGFSGLPFDTLAGTITIPNTFVPDPFEFGKVRVLKDSVPVAVQNIGAGDVTVQLFIGHAYSLELQDGLDVPFGFDPVINRTFTATITFIPEPASLMLGAMHLIGLLTYGCRRRRGA